MSELLSATTSSAQSSETAGAPDGPRSRFVIFGIVSSALFMTAIDLTITATALPAIHSSLGSSVSWTGWTITIYGLGQAVCLPIAGRLGDRFGRRKIFALGVLTFTLMSILCGLTQNIAELIVMRALQALGGASIQPNAAGIISQHFGSSRGRAIAMFGVVSSAGQLSGPIAGGLLVSYLSWRWIFFVNVPVGAVLLILTFRFIPRALPTSASAVGFDVKGMLLASGAVLSAIFGITMLGNGSKAYEPIFFVPECLGVLLAIGFWRNVSRAPFPFIPRRLLTGHGFSVMNLISVIFGIVGFGTASLVPLYAENRYGLRAIVSGTLLTTRAACMLLCGALWATLLKRTGYRLPLRLGFTIVAVGILVMSVAPRFGIGPVVWLSITVGIVGVGLGTINPAWSNANLHLAPDDVAAIAGLRSMFTNLGIILGVAVTTAVVSASAHPGIAQAHIFWITAGASVLAVMPLIARLPEHVGEW
jgi:EmrB/QacA subfamily drug resistance transporter